GDIVSAKNSEATPVQSARDMWVGQAAYDTITARICEMPLRKNNDYNYSCLNFCLLMDMEQRLTGIPHQVWVADSVFAPIGASDIGYRPSERFELSRIAPTEVDPYLRRQQVHGFVHDETAAMLGGVSGNAGLFASAGDLAKLCQTWLNGGTYGDARIWSPETVKLFTTAKSPTCRRGLGFDKPDCERPDYSPTCQEASPETYGHLGFTGTVFWVDPSRDLIFIFLNNRVCPTRENAAFARANIRPALYGTILRNMD
ncbi:MAG: serine hydrolase, partial [Muribaculaceae bacterium]|nr:serine hydrolase [Muribaculaceae bacterium]